MWFHRSTFFRMCTIYNNPHGKLSEGFSSNQATKLLKTGGHERISKINNKTFSTWGFNRESSFTPDWCPARFTGLKVMKLPLK